MDKSLKGVLFFFCTVMFLPLLSWAGPNINTLYVQGYLRKVTGTAVTDGTYSMLFSIRSGSTTFWNKTISVSVSSGFFSQSLSGTSTSPYSGAIDSTTLAAAAAGSLVVNIQVTIDGLPVSFDIQATPVALALLADKANSVVAGSIDSTALTSSSVTSSKIADGSILTAHFNSAGTMPAWDGGALTNITATNITGTLPNASFPVTLPSASGANLTSLNASSLSSGTVSAALLPSTFSKASTFSATGTGLSVTYNATIGGTLGVTGATTLGGALSVTGTSTHAATTIVGTTVINNTGSSTTTIGGGTSTGTISIGASTGAQTVTLGGSSGTGSVTVGNTGSTSATVIQGGSTGKIKVGSAGVAFSSMGACTISSFTAASGANAKTCTSLPTGSAVYCSPSATQGATVMWSSFASAPGTVTINMSAAGAAATWYCMWMVP